LGLISRGNLSPLFIFFAIFTLFLAWHNRTLKPVTLFLPLLSSHTR
jgi:hypothetical protein